MSPERALSLPPLVLLALALFAPAAAWAFEGLLLLPDGTPAGGYKVSVVGRGVSVTTNREGLFRIQPEPPVPFELVATSPEGEVFPSVEVPFVPQGLLEVPLQPVFRDEVTAVAGVAPNIEAPPAAATVTVGQESLEQRRPDRLTDALENVAGISRSDQTTTGVPVVRGLARGRTLILLDGARVTTERRAGPSASFLDPFTVGAIEVARGPGGVAYGSDALGGVIHVRSRYPRPGAERSFRFAVNQGFGAHDETSVGLEAAGDVAGGALLGQITWREAGDMESAGGEAIPFSSSEDRGGALRYAADTRWGLWKAGFSLADSYDVGKPASDSDQIRTVYPRESSRRFNLGLDAGPVAGWDSLEVGLFLGTYRLALERDRLAADPRLVETSDVESDDGSLRVVASRAAWGGRLLAGAEVVSRFGLEALTARETLDGEGERLAREASLSIEDARQLGQALFVTFDRPVASRALLSAGVRGDRVETENRGGFFGDLSTENASWSGHAALTVGPFRDVTASVQVARGFRDPTLSDRYFRGPTGRGFIVGNPELDPETSLQLDSSVRWSSGGRSLALFAYDYTVDHLVERYREGRDFFFRNRGEAEIRGLELEAQTPLGRGVSLELVAAVARGEAEDGSPLADIAAPNGAATVRWAGERGFAWLRGGLVREDDRPGPTEVERPGHALLDLGAGWRVTPELELRLVGRNLTDRRYRDSPDESAALARGRSFSLGLVGRM